MNLYHEAAKLQDNGVAFATATIIESKGSTPRNTAKMIVKGDGEIIGTIGGGPAEALIIQEAVAAIKANQSKVVEYTMDKDAVDGIQMQCGGSISVFIEVAAPQPRIVMIGAGHVGFAVAKLVESLGYRLVVIDDRQEFANAERYPMASEIYWNSEIGKAIEPLMIDSDSYIIIATKDADYQALSKVVTSNAAYIGMIGSKRKVGLVMEDLRREGVPEVRLQSIHMPIGLDIGAETPEEIAVSILAEIIKFRNGKSGLSLHDLK